jgi:hypothetical protein
MEPIDRPNDYGLNLAGADFGQHPIEHRPTLRGALGLFKEDRLVPARSS